MKSKTLFSFYLIMFIAMTNLSAQQPETEGTKSIPWDNLYYIYEEVYCDGAYVETLIGPMVWHNISHFVNGEEVWEISVAIGEITSNSGEVFRVNELDKQLIPKAGKIFWHTNLVGNMGSHYIFSGTINADWSDMIINEIACPVNKKNK